MNNNILGKQFLIHIDLILSSLGNVTHPFYSVVSGCTHTCLTKGFLRIFKVHGKSHVPVRILYNSQEPNVQT